MARPEKTGLDYFPLDVDFFDDDKISAVFVEYGVKGEIAAVKLLCAVYRNGYFIEWCDSLRIKMLKNLPGVSKELLEQIVRSLVKYGFFDREMFETEQVLTSKGIQRRYFASKRKKPKKEMPHILVFDELTRVFAAKTPVIAAKTPVIAATIPQNKEKKRKEKENKDKERKKDFSLSTEKPGFSDGEREIDFQKFKEFFNYYVRDRGSKIRPVDHMTQGRRDALLALLSAGYTKDELSRVIIMATSSAQLNGRTKKSFIPDFDWIFSEENFVRILEGNFNQT